MSTQTDAILDLCRSLPPTRTAIVHPVTANVVAAAAEATRAGLVVPVPVGPAARITAAAKE
ncbi:MAG: enoyl-CoA hydratase, partial [Rhizobiales bacterium]|nr:enoyl-CoA hydratase [Hyphomicrobiales bacterium]